MQTLYGQFELLDKLLLQRMMNQQIVGCNACLTSI